MMALSRVTITLTSDILKYPRILTTCTSLNILKICSADIPEWSTWPDEEGM
jgi:hypothetical protein